MLAIGDPHFKVDNMIEVEKLIDSIENVAKLKKPDIIIILGDLLHTHERLHTTALNKAYDFVHRMSAISKTYILVGNHDMISNQEFLTENHWMNGMKKWNNVTIVDHVMEVNYKDNFRLVLAPYVYPGRFQEALNTLDSDWKTADLIFAHQEFYGCKMGAIISTDGDKWELNFPLVISGHIHSKQWPQSNVYYTGSSMQHAFGESEQNIIAYITPSTNPRWNIKEIDLMLPRKRIVYTDIEDVTNTLSNLKINQVDKIKLSILGEYEQFKAFKKSS